MWLLVEIDERDSASVVSALASGGVEVEHAWGFQKTTQNRGEILCWVDGSQPTWLPQCPGVLGIREAFPTLPDALSDCTRR
jgi:hypothetical protein